MLSERPGEEDGAADLQGPLDGAARAHQGSYTADPPDPGFWLEVGGREGQPGRAQGCAAVVEKTQKHFSSLSNAVC